MASGSLTSQKPIDNKSLVREQVWSELQRVALPDSRFHHDYSSFIADFIGSSAATNLLASLYCYKEASILFIAPDNCLRELRYRALQDGKKVLVTTYGIRRGFFLLDPMAIESGKWEVASFLDGVELYGRHISLTEIKAAYGTSKIPLMVTGTGAISSRNGLRFGKGHGFFDLEWGMLFSIGVVDRQTSTVAVCHECQVVDEELLGEEWDTGCDFVVTSEKINEVKGVQKPTKGIIWEKLKRDVLEGVEPLGELKGFLGTAD